MGRRDESVGVKTQKAPNSAEGAGIAVAEHGASAAEAYGFVGFVLTGAFRAPKPKFSIEVAFRPPCPVSPSSGVANVVFLPLSQ